MSLRFTRHLFIGLLPCGLVLGLRSLAKSGGSVSYCDPVSEPISSENPAPTQSTVGTSYMYVDIRSDASYSRCYAQKPLFSDGTPFSTILGYRYGIADFSSWSHSIPSIAPSQSCPWHHLRATVIRFCRLDLNGFARLVRNQRISPDLGCPLSIYNKSR